MRSARDSGGYTLETDGWYNRADDKVWANVRAYEAGITRFKLRDGCGWRIVAISVWQNCLVSSAGLPHVVSISLDISVSWARLFQERLPVCMATAIADRRITIRSSFSAESVKSSFYVHKHARFPSTPTGERAVVELPTPTDADATAKSRVQPCDPVPAASLSMPVTILLVLSRLMRASQEITRAMARSQSSKPYTLTLDRSKVVASAYVSRILYILQQPQCSTNRVRNLSEHSE